MKHARKLLLILALAATAASSLPVSSHARKGDVALPTEMQASTVGGGPTEESWWGALSAIGCGFGIRNWWAYGWNFAYNVAVVGACGLALLDSAS